MADENKKQNRFLGMVPQVAQNALGVGLGMLTAKWQDKRQLKQAEKLQALQLSGQKSMADYQQQLALDMWDKTNYGAQLKQLKDAGLSVGLMYGQGGQGGSTSGAGVGGSVSGQSASPEQNLGMGLMLAQIENMKADTASKNAGTARTEAETKIIEATGMESAQANIDQIASQIENRQFQNEIYKAQARGENIRADISEKSAEALIDQAVNLNNKLYAEAQQAINQDYIQKGQADELIKNVRLQNDLLVTEIAFKKEGIELSEAKRKDIASIIEDRLEGRRIDWMNWDNNERLTFVKEIYADFDTGVGATLGQWTGAIGNIVNGVGRMRGTGRAGRTITNTTKMDKSGNKIGSTRTVTRSVEK